MFHQLIGGDFTILGFLGIFQKGILFIEPWDVKTTSQWLSIRHPPVARADMATVGTSMSDGRHEVGHQVWCEKWMQKNPLGVLEMDFCCWMILDHGRQSRSRRSQRWQPKVVPRKWSFLSGGEQKAKILCTYGKFELCEVNFSLEDA